ncbi:MAG: ATPase, T2SS/T4P/T4SS family [Candidatus Saccharimonas aalborgensis]|jgi:type IV pilus assembly protein PilB|uniref:Putative type II secretion system protein E n=1 Tax=Candidatus Saccharimonas aalborgensis TaxID=1332188 RepID=R4PVS8_9BACT|nr:GspE/PulE family protein [Candidatus Saccharimonas aalborgensis]AGL62360.1 putative type II secretion system protein E [Candidatus Saccharimonas aalborgensis]MBP7775059.1 Flp pilus assembly complex ATPase component TadA [Candidatus Saccharimonas sp.]QQS68860.1 MAG: Flp pilus assembly complex ATPase component TadA [Candidatus Saccharibacteria bacterium]QQS70207.1 MAG: Flp pilus assembly complex ATPase component TadA [Candidatus Saccharibacteria bacterium]
MALMTNDIQEKLVKLLTEEGLVSTDVIQSATTEAAGSGKTLLTVLTEQDAIDDELLTHAIAQVSGVPYVNLSNSVIDQGILSLLPSDIAERFMAVPLAEVQNRLAVAMIDANNVQAVDYLANRIQRPLKVFMASEAGVRHVLDQYKTDLSSVDVAAEVSQKEAAQEETKDIKTIVQDSPISRALSTILEYAVKSRASDIHIEPFEKALKIRCRVDGVLREVMQLPKSIEPALISRIKILSNLKIDEHRTPQDGQFAVKVGNKEVDLRIAISPVVWGEQVVIRLLDKSGNSFDLEEMGYAGRALRTIQKGVKKPNGMLLTSGPTGSGKSTSLYALIKEIKDETINIVTLEDPVEYKMDGVNQIQVNAEVGLTFASGLRSILRQDPNVVMVGEIRDGETANLAVQAALTGHLVFSTLHTNSAAGVLPRLLDMGIEPFLIASTVNTIIGQRLVRRVAPQRDAYWSSPLETKSILDTVGHLLPKTKEEVARVSADLGYKDLPLAGQTAYTLVKGRDTPSTPRGYTGRAGLYEVMDITEEIQDLIVARSTSADIQRKAVEQGMITMRQDGYLKALTGVTTLEEVNRVAADTA